MLTNKGIITVSKVRGTNFFRGLSRLIIFSRSITPLLIGYKHIGSVKTTVQHQGIDFSSVNCLQTKSKVLGTRLVELTQLPSDIYKVSSQINKNQMATLNMKWLVKHISCQQIIT